MSLSELDELKYHLAMAKATLQMCPKKNQRGFTSLEISSGGRSVKLDANSRANIQRNIDRIKTRIRELESARR